jgi:hypothetical protein
MPAIVNHQRLGSRLTWVIRYVALLISLSSPAVAQSSPPGTRHVQWPLLDLVMIPESTGVWLLVGPTPATEQWKSGSDLVHLAADPVLTLQWVTVARRLAPGSMRVTPKLQCYFHSSEFVVLGRNEKDEFGKRAFVLVAADSAPRVQWKAFASAEQVESFLTALEKTAMATREIFKPIAEPEPEIPVSIVTVPMPKYPATLASRGRIGRVWMQYVVGADGRAQSESFRPLLTDHPLFTQAAVAAILQGRFKPARLKGKPIPARVFQAVVFRM